MHILEKITKHHEDEHNAVKDAIDAQKVRVSLEKRIYNAEKFINEECAESHKKHVALAKLHDFRIAVEDMLNDAVETENT